MRARICQIFLILTLFLLLNGCLTLSSEFRCEDNGGIWLDNKCNLGTSDAGYICSDNTECQGYCQINMHPKAIKERQLFDFDLYGTCSENLAPRDCATSLNNGNVQEICRS